MSCHPSFGNQLVPSSALFRAVDPEAFSIPSLCLFSAVSSKLDFSFFLFATMTAVSFELADREGRISCGRVGKYLDKTRRRLNSVSCSEGGFFVAVQFQAGFSPEFRNLEN